MPLDARARGLTWRSFLVGAVLVGVWLFYDCTLAISPQLSNIELIYLIGFGALFTLFVVQFFNRQIPERWRLTPQELTVIYAAVAVAAPWGILVRSALESPLKLAVIYASKDDACLAWMKPPWCIANRDAVHLFRRGGASFSMIRWDLWMTPMLYWGAILLSFQAFAVFCVLFLRELLVDEERLPFPMAQTGLATVEYDPPEDASVRSTRLRWASRIAYLLGLGLCLRSVFSITPDASTPVPVNISYFGTRLDLIEGMSIPIAWDPFVMLFLVFFGVDVLLTAVLFHVGLEIVIPVSLRWLGVNPAGVADFYSEGFVSNILGMGGLAGLVFWTLFFNRRRVLDFLRRALNGTRKRTVDNPLGYRAVIVGMVLSFAAFVALFIYGMGELGADAARHIIVVAICMAVIVTVLVAAMRQNTEAGWHYHSPWVLGKVIAYPSRFYLTDPAPLFETPPNFYAIGNTIHFGSIHNTYAPHLHLFDALRMAWQTHTPSRDVLKAVVLTLLVAMPVVMVGYLVTVHHYGFDHGDTPAEYAHYTWSQPMIRMAYEATPSIFTKFAPWFAIPVGMAIVGVVMYLRREYVGFPLSPVGVVLAASITIGGYDTTNTWFAMAVVLLFKHTVYRWYGVKFFREKVVPVVLYAMMGLMTGMLLFKLVYASLGKGYMSGM